jgi:hypothetical protein
MENITLKENTGRFGGFCSKEESTSYGQSVIHTSRDCNVLDPQRSMVVYVAKCQQQRKSTPALLKDKLV